MQTWLPDLQNILHFILNDWNCLQEIKVKEEMSIFNFILQVGLAESNKSRNGKEKAGVCTNDMPELEKFKALYSKEMH